MVMSRHWLVSATHYKICSGHPCVRRDRRVPSTPQVMPPQRPSKIYDYQLRPDQTASEHLLDLVQGDCSEADYAVEFSVLVAHSGLNQKALPAIFRHGLSSRQQKELVFHGKQWTLNLFIETAVMLDSLTQDHEPRPRPVPATCTPLQSLAEPMQLGHGRLTTKERQRRF
ncbi:hypothetical protein Z043_125238 [Scleropages formosus]|uniref:Retrotransposon gag domain-containing protein n=1 Tax=Scleropages formosus TaxID=113540 RepID=A0A0N8JV40_SCLFO|nr:hypothetical protein Z043_125238 [Scleropages formosus]